MLNRRFIREKVIQSLYSYFQGAENRAEAVEKNMLLGIEKIYQLYIWQFSALVALRDFEKNRMEDAKNKHIPSPSDLNPNTKFLDNPLIDQIQQNPIYILKSNEFSCNWAAEEHILRHVWQEIHSYKAYIEYMDEGPVNYEACRDILLKIYRKKIVDDPLFRTFFEENSIFWEGDYESVCFWVVETLKSMEEGKDDFIEQSFSVSGDTKKQNEEVEFAQTLIRNTILQQEEYQKLVFDRLQNWDSERIALIELIILRTAIAELLNCPSISIKVSLNEYIEITKRFCSEKSRIFVNGILHKITEDLQAEGKIKKSGRGLI